MGIFGRGRDHHAELAVELLNASEGVLQLSGDDPASRQALVLIRAITIDNLEGDTAPLQHAAATFDGAVTGWKGSDRLAPLAIPALFDKLLGNLFNDLELAADFLTRVRTLNATAPRDGRPPFANVIPLVLGKDLNYLFDKLGENAPIIRDPALESAVAGQLLRSWVARLEAQILLLRDEKRLGAITEFEPFEAARHPVAEIAFWAYWDATCLGLSHRGGDSLNLMRDCISHQCATYADQGPPSPHDLGIAAYGAAARVGLL
ncbi:MAG: hypothetical protein U0R69_02920 [Gaiellales bacterium]